MLQGRTEVRPDPFPPSHVFLTAVGVMIRSLRVLVLLVFLLTGLWGSQPFADSELQLQGDQVARISRTFQNFHLSQEPFNDRRSEQMLTHFLNLYDPGHYYFLQSDINEFMVYKDRLDDQLRTGNIDGG